MSDFGHRQLPASEPASQEYIGHSEDDGGSSRMVTGMLTYALTLIWLVMTLIVFCQIIIHDREWSMLPRTWKDSASYWAPQSFNGVLLLGLAAFGTVLLLRTASKGEWFWTTLISLVALFAFCTELTLRPGFAIIGRTVWVQPAEPWKSTAQLDPESTYGGNHSCWTRQPGKSHRDEYELHYGLVSHSGDDDVSVDLGERVTPETAAQWIDALIQADVPRYGGRDIGGANADGVLLNGHDVNNGQMRGFNKCMAHFDTNLDGYHRQVLRTLVGP